MNRHLIVSIALELGGALVGFVCNRWDGYYVGFAIGFGLAMVYQLIVYKISTKGW